MNTVINNPGNNDSSSGTGLVVGIIIAIVLVILFFRYGLPAMRGGDDTGGTNINVTIPNPIESDTSTE